MTKPTLWKRGIPAWFRGRHSETDGKIPITAGAQGVIGNVYGIERADLIVLACNWFQQFADKADINIQDVPGKLRLFALDKDADQDFTYGEYLKIKAVLIAGGSDE